MDGSSLSKFDAIDSENFSESTASNLLRQTRRVKTVVLCEIMRNDGHWAVQGHRC